MNGEKNQNEINIGVDTGKTQLDIYIRPLDIFFTVSNDEKGIKKELKKQSQRSKNTNQLVSLLKQPVGLNMLSLWLVQKQI